MNVEQIQHLLAYLGYMEVRETGEKYRVDGILGPQTEKAVREFQADYGIDVDGAPGPQTQKALRDAVAYNKFRPEKKPEPVPDSGTIWDNSPWWSREEFKCRCGGKYCNGFPVEPDPTLVMVANRVRENLGHPAHRTSGIRCEQWNALQPNAAKNSKHKAGKALDFWVEKVTGKQLLAEVKRHPEVNYAYIVKGNVVHMDVK